jgi:6-pyruvoyltetrahydropterin/6-carboxytetrahydropterin synthase
MGVKSMGNSVLRITRGVPVHIAAGGGGRVGYGLGSDLRCGQIPLWLWVTFEGDCGESGMVVNVSEIGGILRQVIAEREVICEGTLGLLGWVRQEMGGVFENCRLVRVQVDVNEFLEITYDSMESEMIRLTRKYELAASHCLHNKKWDAQKNSEVYGKCANPAGHGHNYLLEVTLSGLIDNESGQIACLEEVDGVVAGEILRRFDHKNLNEDTQEFAERVATVENMAKVFWDRLIGKFGAAELVKIKLWETAKTYAEYSEVSE